MRTLIALVCALVLGTMAGPALASTSDGFPGGGSWNGYGSGGTSVGFGGTTATTGGATTPGPTPPGGGTTTTGPGNGTTTAPGSPGTGTTTTPPHPAGQRIATALPGYPYIETGWATPYGSPRAAPCYHEGRSTNSGKDMERFLASLGAYPGEAVAAGPTGPAGKLC